jgi:hypothetical protein
MITRDYFLRMIHQLVNVIAKVLKAAEVKQYDAALDEIQSSSKLLLGMDLRMLSTLSDAEFIRLLSLGDRFDVEKCIVAAELLRLTGEVRERQGDEAGTYQSYTVSLSLFLELLFRETETLPKEYFDKIEGIIKRLSTYEPLPELQRKMFRYYGITGRYDAAENILFDLVQLDAAFGVEGVRFYEQLKTKSDAELEKGNLPRSEVEAGLLELRKITM